jgi:hypothetical protein
VAPGRLTWPAQLGLAVAPTVAELHELIGLEDVKAQVELVADLTRVQLLRAQRGLPVLEQSRHLVLSGDPGTGKTTVARVGRRDLPIARRGGEGGHLVEDRRDRVVVIMAGHPDEMAELVAANPGLRSRFPRTVHFPDYDPDEAVESFRMPCDRGGYRPSRPRPPASIFGTGRHH